MKIHSLFFGMLISSSSLFAASKGVAQQGQTQMQGQGQTQMMAPAPDCSQLNPDEQDFANQITDTNNKSTFCSQFTPQQRKQAMQMMNQPDAQGNMMNADQSVQQVMINSGQRRTRTGGGCPVK
jgi:hypothetical protein